MGRDALLARIHVTAKNAGLDEDARRDIYERVTGKRSLSLVDQRGRFKVMEELARLAPAAAAKKGGDRRPIVRKAQALWIGLHNLDEVENKHDRALDAFAQRITGKERLQFCANGEAGKVVEALKEWAKRVGLAVDASRDVLAPTRALIRRQRSILIKHLQAGATPEDEAAINRLIVDRIEDATSTTLLYGLANRGGEILRRLQLGKRHSSPNGTGADHE
jgi:phage gp16-like protein